VLIAVGFATAPARALPAPQDAAAVAPGTQVITDVRVEGNRRITDAGFFRLTTLRTGQNYDDEEIRRQYRIIWSSNLFDDLWVEALDTAGGKVVVFHLVERPVVISVDYGKSAVMSVSAIEDRLRERDLEVALNQPLDRDRIREVEEEIKRAHEEKGFLGTQVDTDVTGGGLQAQAVRFKIKAGAKTLIKKINFDGNEIYKDGQLKDLMANTMETGIKGMFSKKDNYHPQRFSADLESVRRAYLAKGRLDVNIKAPVVEILDDGKEPKAPPPPPSPKKPKKNETEEQKQKRLARDAEDLAKYEKKMAKRKLPKRKAIITVEIEEGPEYKVGKVTVEGSTVFTESVLMSLIPLQPGAVFNADALQGGMDAIESLYGQRGYFYAATNRGIERQGGEDHIADVAVTVNEGDQYTLGKIEFVGNTSTRDRVLRRELPLSEGDIFDTRLWQIGLTRVNQLGYWALTEEPEIKPSEKPKQLDARITGAEQGRNEIQVGGGFSGVEGAFFQGSYATRNFLGRGSILQSSLQVGGTSQLINISYTEPYFMGTNNTVGGSIFVRRLQFTTFTRNAKGFTLMFGRRLGNFTSWNTTYRFEKFNEAGGNIFFFDVSQLPPGYEDLDLAGLFNRQFGTAVAAFETTTNSSIVPRFTFNTVNNPFRPNKGQRLDLNLEFTGGPLGGDNNFIKPIVSYTAYRPIWKKTHLAFNAEGGAIISFDDALIPRSERFFLGGDTRGPRVFETRSLAPLGPIAGVEPITDNEGNVIGIPFSEVGGDKFLLFQLEYIWQVSKPLDLALFIDSGQSYGEVPGFSLSDLRTSYGIEVRFHLPVFQAPLRLIWGRVLDEQPGDRLNSFQFSIGFPF
jgi:outer membrane protein insertion porin family